MFISTVKAAIIKNCKQTKEKVFHDGKGQRCLKTFLAQLHLQITAVVRLLVCLITDNVDSTVALYSECEAPSP